MGTVTKSKALRGDFNSFDGTLSKSRTSSSGGTVTGLAVNDYVDVLQVFGSGSISNRNDSTITTALNTLGGSNIALLFAPGTWTVSNTITLPSNITVIVPAGCVFDIASGKTMTISGVFFRQHATYASGSGTFTISGTDILAAGSMVSHYATDTGNADLYLIDVADNPASYEAGQQFSFLAKNANTGSSTLDVEGLGAKDIKKYDNDGTLDALESGDIIQNQIVTVRYDGTQFQMIPNKQVPSDIVTTSTDNSYSKTETWKQGADVASASSLPIDVDGNSFDVTGTGVVTSIASKGIGTSVVLQFDGACTLTHHANDLILPSGLNITTQAGDIAVFYEYASADWRCISYTGKNAVFNSVTSSGDITSAGTINATGDTSAGDDAAIGFTSAEGLILTGQGTTNDITIKNDADIVVAKVETGTTVFDLTTALAIDNGGTGATSASAAATALGQPTYAKADIASATNMTIPTTGNYFDVTGTTTIVTMAVAVHRHFFLQFDAVLTLTHDGSDIDLPSAASIQTAAGDVAEFYSIATNDVSCVNYTRANGTAVVGATAFDGFITEKSAGDSDVAGDLQIWVKDDTPNILKITPDTGVDQDVITTLNTQIVVQIVNSKDGAVATGTTVMPTDDTIPQITEGDQYMSLAITPKNASNILLIEAVLWLGHSANDAQGIALFQDSTAGALSSGVHRHIYEANAMAPVTMMHYMAAGTTSSTTFRIRAGAAGGTQTFNGWSAARKHGGVMGSILTITEHKP